MTLVQNEQRAPVDVVGGPPIPAGGTGDVDLTVAFNADLVDRGVLAIVDPDADPLPASPVGVRARPSYGQRDVLIDLGEMTDGEALVKGTDDAGLVTVEGLPFVPPADFASEVARAEAAEQALTTAVALKQDAATAATDAELAAAVALLLPKAGGTMTGALTLSGDPTSALHAATRQYVIAQINALINGAPGTLDTLKEIADQLAGDESAATALAGLVSGLQASKQDAATAATDAELASAVSTLNTALGLKLDANKLGAANGAAQLDSTGKLPNSSLHDPVISPGQVTTGLLLQGIGGYDATGNVPFQGLNQLHALMTGGTYHQSAGRNVFHFASYADNDGSDPTVAVFGGATGRHVFGGNFVAYARGDGITANGAAIGVEIDFGIIDPLGGTATGLLLAAIGGNVGGGPNAQNTLDGVSSGATLGGTFITCSANNPLSQVPIGLKFNGGTYQPIGTQTGTRVTGTLASGSSTVTGVSPTAGYANGDYFSANGVPAGTKILSGAGTSTLTLTANATATGAIGSGGAFVFTNGTGTLISGGGSVVAAGIDFSAAVFSTAAIQLGPGGNLKFDTATGTKIGTATGQKIGFWNATPITKPTVTGAMPSGGPKNLITALANAGLVTDSTTAAGAGGYADLASGAFRGHKQASGGTMMDSALAASSSAAMTSGTAYAFVLPLQAGAIVTSLAAYPNSAGSGVTGLYYMLLDPTRHVIDATANLSGSLSTVELDAPLSLGAYTVPADGYYYFAILPIFSTTTPTFRAFTSSTEVTNANTPIRCGASTTGLSAPPAVGVALNALTGYGSIVLGGAF